MTMLPLMLSLGLLAQASADIDPTPPKEVDVLPVFFVAQGESLPTREQKSLLMKHLKMSQDRFRELLGDTFRIAGKMPDVYRGKRPFAFYKEHDGGAPHFVGELLEHYGFNRFNCSHVFMILVMNPRDDFPPGGGRPCNGGYNTGCGLLQMSSFALDKVPNFQSTLEHELAHGFGLPHVDVYGYDMKTSDSIMSYNQAHHTKGLRPSATPGRFIAEDFRALSFNKRVFKKFRFDPATDVPAGESISPRIVCLPPLDIPGQPQWNIKVTTTSGETFGSKVSNIVHNQIKPSKGPGVTFDPHTMWSSAASQTGWVSFDLTFPFPVTLAKMGIHTQHSGLYHPANRAKVQVRMDDADDFRDVAESELGTVDALITLPETRGKTWRVQLRAGPSKIVVVRGLRFFSPKEEILPPPVPYVD
jgi:hypothetical protein